MDGQSFSSEGTRHTPFWVWVCVILTIACISYGMIYYFLRNTFVHTTVSVVPPPVLPTRISSTPPTLSPTPPPAVQTMVIITEYLFTPSIISVYKNQQVHITFMNNGRFPHSASIPTIGVATQTLLPGKSETLSFVASESGSFTFLSPYPRAGDQRMQGTLTVQ